VLSSHVSTDGSEHHEQRKRSPERGSSSSALVADPANRWHDEL